MPGQGGRGGSGVGGYELRRGLVDWGRLGEMANEEERRD